MSKIIDEEYIDRFSSLVDNFTWERQGLARFSCPFCNDGHKRRGYWIFSGTFEKGYYYHCHNCNAFSGSGLGNVLQEIDKISADDYFMAKFEERGGRVSKQRTLEEIKKEEKNRRGSKARTVPLMKPKVDTFQDPVFSSMTCLEDMERDHYAAQYALNRKIPPEKMKLLYFTTNWKKTSEALDPEEQEMLHKLPEDSRLVIPFFDTRGKVAMLQGRAFDPNAKIRYLSTKKTASTEKTYGLERLNFSKPKLVVEGPIDSLFIPNCVATADSNLLKFSDGDIYIPDNQYRNSEICHGIKRIIEAGKKVVLFPPTIEEKDINEMVEARGQIEVLNIIKKNIYAGIDAELQFATLNKSPTKRRKFNRV